MFRSEPRETAELAQMRSFVAMVLRGTRDASLVPPSALVRINHLGPIAYRLGHVAFRDEYAASTIVAMRRAAMLAEVVTMLARSNVQVALLKGIGFVGTIYPDPAERPMNDIDLLVPRSQFAAAMTRMTELGFEYVGTPWMLSSNYHAVTFTRDAMMIDLHRNVVQEHRTSVRLDEIWRRAFPDPEGSGALRLDPVDELLLCALHIARHELAVPALSYVDVSRLWADLDDAARGVLAARARQYRASRAISAVLAMTALLRDGVSGRPALAPARRMLPSTDDVLLGVVPGRWRQIGQKLLLTEGVREILGFGVGYVSARAGLR